MMKYTFVRNVDDSVWFPDERCRMSSVWERADAADQSRPGEIYFHVGTGPRQLCRRMAVYTQ